MLAGSPRLRLGLLVPILASLAVLTPACGGGSTGGPGPDGAGQGLELINFLQAGQDNVPLNRILEFRFSEPVDPTTITTGSIQIREGPQYGLTVTGEFVVQDARVYFKPVLPTLCDKSDAGFKPGTTYRVTLMGYPEQFAIRNTQGQSLTQTTTYEFGTRPESDPEFLEDQVPGEPPAVISRSPGYWDATDQEWKSEAGVTVQDGNEVVIGFSENVDPCSINNATCSLWMYEVGDPGVENEIPADEVNAGNKTGFDPWFDSLPDDPYSWGGNATPVTPPQRVPALLDLQQDFESTQLRIEPAFGRFPENALIVVQLTFGIVDFGGQPLTPLTFSFTTENLPQQTGEMTVDFSRTTESWPISKRTADVDTSRSPGMAQGWMLFAGDGDNGSSTSVPSFPMFNPFQCAARPNDGTLDHFDPDDNVNLNTGSTQVPESCVNQTDGSNAVIYEFATFRIRNGVTVTVTGVNPVIILVQGEVLIESGGLLRAKGGTGGSGSTYGQSLKAGSGGKGVAGGGNGGDGCRDMNQSSDYGDDGTDGYGSPDRGVEGGVGSGQGSVGADSNSQYSNIASSASAGGGGHATAGTAGTANFGSSNTSSVDTDRGLGGGTYPTDGEPEKMYTPSCGSGGGGSAYGCRNISYTYAYYYYIAPGGGGGAGGGFIDITSQADIRVYGTIDVGGGTGGAGGAGGYWSAGGAGGGSGGGCRLLTPADIDLTNGSISAAGGPGGPGRNPGNTTANPKNNGGAGGAGRIALEDGDALISGIGNANLTPGFGTEGFYVGKFQATRFAGGGLIAEATSDPILVGPLSSPTFEEPAAADFVCGIPSDAANGTDGTSMILEARGLPMLPDGTADLTAPDVWWTIGFFSNSGTPNLPTWTPSANPPDATPGENNAGAGISHLDGYQFLEIRVRFFLPVTIGATDPGPWIDRATLSFTYDQ